MLVRSASIAAVSAACLVLSPLHALAQEDMARDAEAAPDHAALLENALSAAPEALAGSATVADWEGNVLQPGTNGYTCLPDDPEVPGNAPMCLDDGWLAWAASWTSRSEVPALESMAFGYMLQGDMPVSNIDPYATEPSEDNEWIEDSGPHVMVLVPDSSMLDGITTDHENGGPYVMWKDTPYAHLMIPVTKKN